MQRTQPKTKIGASKGSTLVELTVVLAVIAIVMTMIVSFTVLIKRHQSKNDQEFLFLEKTSDLKKDILEWFTFTDGDSTLYSIQNGELVATVGGVRSSVLFFDGVLTVGEDRITTQGVDGVLFFSQGQVIKCTFYATIGNKQKQISFVFSPRCGYVLNSQSQQGGFNA